jgi:hypothetical protein
MDAVTNTIAMWQNEMIVVLVTCAGLVAFHYLNKLWGAPGDVTFTVILAINLVAVSVLLYSMRYMWHLHVSNRAIIFLALYAWCVCAMLFFTSKQTHFLKIFLALVSQAGILYGLFIWL